MIVDFAVPVDHRVKLKDSEKKDCCIVRVYKYTREHNQPIMTTSITNEYTSL